MRVFVTGSTGYIGSRVCARLSSDGTSVAGLTRSTVGAQKLEQLGVEARRGDLTHIESVVDAAADADAIIHIPASHDFAGGEALDRALTQALLDSLEGTDKAFVYTSGARIYGDTHGTAVNEDAPLDPPGSLRTRVEVEQEVLAAVARGIRTAVIRPTLTHGRAGSAAMTFLINDLQRNRVARYVDEGTNAWSFVHVDDLADLFALIITRAPAGSLWNGASGEPVALKALAEAMGTSVGAPAASLPYKDAQTAWGEMAAFLRTDMRVDGSKAVNALGWRPHRADVVEEVTSGTYLPLLRA